LLKCNPYVCVIEDVSKPAPATPAAVAAQKKGVTKLLGGASRRSSLVPGKNALPTPKMTPGAKTASNSAPASTKGKTPAMAKTPASIKGGRVVLSKTPSSAPASATSAAAKKRKLGTAAAETKASKKKDGAAASTKGAKGKAAADAKKTGRKAKKSSDDSEEEDEDQEDETDDGMDVDGESEGEDDESEEVDDEEEEDADEDLEGARSAKRAKMDKGTPTKTPRQVSCSTIARLPRLIGIAFSPHLLCLSFFRKLFTPLWQPTLMLDSRDGWRISPSLPKFFRRCP
jgi:hypothetical protein